MKRFCIVMMWIISGCATTHDWCMERLDHYSSYEECYAERTEAKRRAIEGWQNAFGSNNKTVRCSTQTYGNQSYTSCQ